MTADAFWLQLESADAGHTVALSEALEAIAWNDAGLIPVIAQRHDSGEVLMLAWVNRLHKPVGQALSCSAVPHPQGTP